MDMDELVRLTAKLLADADRSDQVLEQKVLALTNDAVLSRRMIDWIPEIYALVLATHAWNLRVPNTLRAKNRNGAWEDFAFDREPCVPSDFKLATQHYHSGEREAFGRVANLILAGRCSQSAAP